MNSLENCSELQPINLQKPITFYLNNKFSLRLYSDSRPHCMETTPLHKGLVLMLDNEELIEEGMGLGLPVVKYNDKTFFSSSADVAIQKNGSAFYLKKTFVMDTISRKKFLHTAYINDGVYSLVHKKFEKLYLGHKNLSPLFNNIMKLRNIAKIKTEFQKVKPRGTIAVTYQIQPDIINVSADFSNLAFDGCEELLLLNEQGSTFFDKYTDTNSLELVGKKIGGWDAVIANQAFMQSCKKHVSFALQKKVGATLFRGWENTKHRFAWAGLSYSLRPNQGIFNYSISFDFSGKN